MTAQGAEGHTRSSQQRHKASSAGPLTATKTTFQQCRPSSILSQLATCISTCRDRYMQGDSGHAGCYAKDDINRVWTNSSRSIAA